MLSDLSSSEIEEKFRDFFQQYRNEEGDHIYNQRINALGYKSGGTLVLDFTHLYLYNPELAVHIINDPRTAIPQLNMAAGQNKVHIRKLPETTPIRQIDSAQIDQLIQVRGIVVRASKDTSKISRAAFKCGECGETIIIEQHNQYLERPSICPSCKSRKRQEIDYHQSKFIDYQDIAIQESPDQLPPGEIPTSLEIVLEEELVRKTNPGDKVNITGIVYVKMSGPSSTKLELTRFIIANHVEVRNRDLDIQELTPRETEELEEIAKDPCIKRRIIQSMAPSIYGYDHIKEAIALQLFGSDAVEKPDVRIRGDINILLVGDPGTAKSQLLKRAAELSHRGIFTTGRGTSAAGLTAAAIKDKNTGGFMLEAGALVLADTGLAAIDEMDKMRDEDRGAIHPAMEQQIVPISKGGIHATLNARCAILAAANPTLGRYNPYQTIAQNISTFPVTLLSRFDLIFVIRDLPEKEKDKKTADHILSIGGEPINIEIIKTPQLRKYISYSKQVKPEITHEILKYVSDYYVMLRQAGMEGGESCAVSITPRQLESIIRLIKARARLELRKTASMEDAEDVLALFTRSMEQVGVDAETGKIDIDLLMTGKPRSLQMVLSKVLNAISEMERHTGVVRDDDLFDSLMSDHGIGRTEAARLIGVLMRDATIYSPRPGYYKRTN